MSDLNRREAMKRAMAAGLAASASTLLAVSVRAENGQEPAREGQPRHRGAGQADGHPGEQPRPDLDPRPRQADASAHGAETRHVRAALGRQGGRSIHR